MINAHRCSNCNNIRPSYIVVTHSKVLNGYSINIKDSCVKCGCPNHEIVTGYWKERKVKLVSRWWEKLFYIKTKETHIQVYDQFILSDWQKDRDTTDKHYGEINKRRKAKADEFIKSNSQ